MTPLHCAVKSKLQHTCTEKKILPFRFPELTFAPTLVRYVEEQILAFSSETSDFTTDLGQEEKEKKDEKVRLVTFFLANTTPLQPCQPACGHLAAKENKKS